MHSLTPAKAAMQTALKNVAGLPSDLAELAFQTARRRKTRLLVCRYEDGRPTLLTVGEYNLAEAQGEELPEKLATARPGGVVS